MFKNKQVIDVEGFKKYIGGFVEIKKGDEVIKGLLKDVEEDGINVTTLRKMKEIQKDLHPINSMMVEIGVACIERIDEMEFGLSIYLKQDEKADNDG